MTKQAAITALVCILFTTTVYAQHQAGQLGFSLEVKGKKEYQCKIDPYPGSSANLFFRPIYGYSVLVNYFQTDRFYYESGLYYDSYYVTWNVDAGNGGQGLACEAWHIPIRIGYETKHIFKTPITYSTSAGFIWGINKGYNKIYRGDGYSFEGVDWKLDIHKRRGKEYDLSRMFGLLEWRNNLNIHLTPKFKAYIGMGYCYGLRPIGIMRADFTYQNSVISLQNNNNGNQVVMYFGLNIVLNN